MKHFTSFAARQSLLLDDVDTDQIAPANLFRTLTPDYKTACSDISARQQCRQASPCPSICLATPMLRSS